MADNLPQEMQYVTFERPGGPGVLAIASCPVPRPGANEVLIRVEAAGVNRPDVAQRMGRYPPPPGASPVLGLEVAGTVAAVGSDSQWLPGDRVCALVAGGGYAEYCLAPDAQCLPIPPGLSAEEAAGIPETYFTVWANVFQLGRLKSEETLLVHGGTSGIGTTAIQLACALGARAFATAGSAEKCESCVRLGAKGAINYKDQDFVAEIERLTVGQGVNVVLDIVGGPYTPRNIACLATGGRLVQISVQQGAEATINLLTIMQKRLTLTGSTLRPRTIEEKSAIAHELREHVWPLLETRQVHVVVDSVFPLHQAAGAHRRLESSQHIGKIVLRVAG